MGGFSRAIGEGLERLWEGGFRSFEGALKKSKTGTILADTLRNQYEPAVAKATNYNRVQGLMSHEDATALAHKQVRTQFFGKKNELLVKALDNIHKETKNAVHVNNVADGLNIYFRDSNKMAGQWRKAAIKAGVPLENAASNYTAPKAGERSLKEIASYIYLPRVVLPHLGQPLNTLLAEGYGPTLRAAASMLKMGPQKAIYHIQSSGAMEEEFFRQMQQNASGGGWFRKAFHMPGFNYMRRMQVTGSALAGEYALKDAFEELKAGNLTRDVKLSLEQHGVKDPQMLLQTGLTDDIIDRARYIAAQRAMFIRSGLDTPYLWHENWTSRLATLYKGYAFNQGRFLTNHIKDSFYKGGPQTWLRTMSVLGVLYPMVGEGIKQIEGLATAQKPAAEDNVVHTGNPAIDEYIDASSHVAGFGIYYQMMRSVKHRMFAEYITGPIVSTLTDLVQDSYSQAKRKKSGVNLVGRDITRRIPLVGAPLANTVFPRKVKQKKIHY